MFILLSGYSNLFLLSLLRTPHPSKKSVLFNINLLRCQKGLCVVTSFLTFLSSFPSFGFRLVTHEGWLGGFLSFKSVN